MHSIQMYVALNSSLEPVAYIETPEGHLYPRIRFNARDCDRDIASALIGELVRVLDGTRTLGFVANEFAETTTIEANVFENGFVIDIEGGRLLGSVGVADYQVLLTLHRTEADNEHNF